MTVLSIFIDPAHLTKEACVEWIVHHLMLVPFLQEMMRLFEEQPTSYYLTHCEEDLAKTAHGLRNEVAAR
jgi:hypothetical protein